VEVAPRGRNGCSFIPAKKRGTVVKPVKNKHRCKRKLSEAMPQQMQQSFSCLTARKKKSEDR